MKHLKSSWSSVVHLFDQNLLNIGRVSKEMMNKTIIIYRIRERNIEITKLTLFLAQLLINWWREHNMKCLQIQMVFLFHNVAGNTLTTFSIMSHALFLVSSFSKLTFCYMKWLFCNLAFQIRRWWFWITWINIHSLYIGVRRLIGCWSLHSNRSLIYLDMRKFSL